MIIQNQEEANQRANEIVSRYNLQGVFDKESAPAIAMALWQSIQSYLLEDDYLPAIEMMELAYYLDTNYYYSFILGMIYFENANIEQTIYYLENSLELLAGGNTLYPPLQEQISQRMVLQSLYSMLIQSYVEADRLEDALGLYDSTQEYFTDFDNPDFFIMVAQLLATAERTNEAIALLEKATTLASAIEDEEVRNDSLRMINDLLSTIQSQISSNNSLPAPENAS